MISEKLSMLKLRVRGVFAEGKMTSLISLDSEMGGCITRFGWIRMGWQRLTNKSAQLWVCLIRLSILIESRWRPYGVIRPGVHTSMFSYAQSRPYLQYPCQSTHRCRRWFHFHLCLPLALILISTKKAGGARFHSCSALHSVYIKSAGMCI